MNTWIAFWKLLCMISVVIYFLMGLILVPMAIRDLFILLKKLNIDNISHADPLQERKESN